MRSSTAKCRRIGLLGGSFNPVHCGHLIIAQDAMESFELDEVLFVPCAVPVHKNPKDLLPFRFRYEMLELALEHDLQFSVSNVEYERGGASYAIETVQELQRCYAGAEICFIIGADTQLELHTWHRIYELLSLCRFITLCRPGYDDPERLVVESRLKKPWPERLQADTAWIHAVDISSTDIRMRVAEGMRISYLVPSVVEMYIAEHHLFCS